MDIIRGFEEEWGFPQCFVVVDGSHIPILPSHDSPTNYYNQNRSIVLLLYNRWPCKIYCKYLYILSALCIVCTSLPIQGECDRFSCRIQMLESELIERKAHCVELEKQRNEEAENCQVMEVCTLSMLNSVVPNACTYLYTCISKESCTVSHCEEIRTCMDDHW